MTGGLQIQPATKETLPLVRHLAHTIWPDAYAAILSKEQLSYMLELIYSLPSLQQQLTTGHHFVLAYDAGKPIGFADYGPIAPTVYKLHKLYVLTNIQGKGYGKQLLEYVIEKSRQQKATHLQLNVNRHNKALHFYQKMGFEILREEDIDIGQGYFMNDYVLQLIL